MRRLTLTFDNGPTPGITDHVLEVLDNFGVRSTFFLVGSQLAKPGARRLAEMARAQGHWIGNHTATHGDPLGFRTARGEARDEIARMAEMLGDLASPETYFRPNGRGHLGRHLFNRESIDLLAEMRATIVLWNSVPRDRRAVVPTPDVWLEQARHDALHHEWTLMVLHDRVSGHDKCPLDYLPDLLKWAMDNGIELRQDFPPPLVPMRNGEKMAGLLEFVTDGIKPIGETGDRQLLQR